MCKHLETDDFMQLTIYLTQHPDSCSSQVCLLVLTGTTTHVRCTHLYMHISPYVRVCFRSVQFCFIVKLHIDWWTFLARAGLVTSTFMEAMDIQVDKVSYTRVTVTDDDQQMIQASSQDLPFCFPMYIWTGHIYFSFKRCWLLSQGTHNTSYQFSL